MLGLWSQKLASTLDSQSKGLLSAQRRISYLPFICPDAARLVSGKVLVPWKGLGQSCSPVPPKSGSEEQHSVAARIKAASGKNRSQVKSSCFSVVTAHIFLLLLVTGNNECPGWCLQSSSVCRGWDAEPWLHGLLIMIITSEVILGGSGGAVSGHLMAVLLSPLQPLFERDYFRTPKVLDLSEHLTFPWGSSI